MPLVETPAPQNGSSVLCRAPSCVEDPQTGALEALEAQDLRLLSDLLAEEGLNLLPDHAYPDHSSMKELLPPGRGSAGVAQQCPVGK